MFRGERDRLSSLSTFEMWRDGEPSSYLEPPKIDLSIEAFKITMAEMVLEHNRNKQFFVSDYPRTAMRQPANDVLISWCRNDFVKLCGEGFGHRMVYLRGSRCCIAHNPWMLDGGVSIIMICVVNECWSHHPFLLRLRSFVAHLLIVPVLIMISICVRLLQVVWVVSLTWRSYQIELLNKK